MSEKRLGKMKMAKKMTKQDCVSRYSRKQEEIRQNTSKKMRRKLSLAVMALILAAGVNNCFLLPSGSSYIVGAGRQWVVSEGKVGNETEWESENWTETESESETEWESETEEESESETEQESETEEEFESETEQESETEEKFESETERESEAEEESEGEIERGGKEESEAETEMESETEEKTQAETEWENDTEEESEEETEWESEMEVESQADSTIMEAACKSDEEVEAENCEEKSENCEEESETNSETETITEPAESVERGVHYEVLGDSGSWYRDVNGLLWIKAGTSVSIEPIPGSGYNTGSSMENLTTDGKISFTLKKIKKDGTVRKESALQEESYYVDGEAPSAKLQISGNQIGEITYASGSCMVSVLVEPDGKSGLKEASYKILPCDLNGSVSEAAEDAAWTECGMSTSFSISEDGLFRVYVKTIDMVGNVAYSRSGVICVDGTAPVITIAGVGDQSANSGSVSLSVSCSDSWYKAGSMQVSIVGTNQGNMPVLKESGSSDTGEWVEYYDFPELQSYDDIYTVSVTAEDMTGNIARKTIHFSINRFGSAYDLSAETKTLLEKYFLSEACDVVFYETNIDYVGESAVYCRHDGVLRELEAGVDYLVSMEGSERTWKRYCYTVPAAYFSREGVYELLLVSQDTAQNQSDTGIQKKRVTFVIDRSAPSCTLSGIQSGGVYEEESITVQVIPNDNLGLNCLRIYHNSELLLENSNQPTSGESVRVTLESGEEWQTLQVWLSDMAGNEYWSEEIPVFISTAGGAVPAYEKTRKSAMELAEEAEALQNGEEQSEHLLNEQNETEAEELGDDSASEEGERKAGSEGDNDVGLSTGTASDAQLSGTNRTTSDGGEILKEDGDKKVNWIVLAIGVLMFIITTFSVYPVFGKRFK